MIGIFFALFILLISFWLSYTFILEDKTNLQNILSYHLRSPLNHIRRPHLKYTSITCSMDVIIQAHINHLFQST